MYHLDLTSRSEYKQRPAAGSGYDDHHAALLREMQTQQAEERNKPGGYWIAEADPTAAIDTFRGPFVDHGCSDSRDMRSTRRRQQPQDSLFSQVSANTQTWGSRGRRFESCQPDRRDREPSELENTSSEASSCIIDDRQGPPALGPSEGPA
jgi:hypothetical protein